jgi:hypothetical protein
MLLLSFGGKIAEKPNFGNYFIMLGVFWSSLHPLRVLIYQNHVINVHCAVSFFKFIALLCTFFLPFASVMKKNKKFAGMSLFM